MFATIVDTFAAVIGYDPYVYNEALATLYWQNPWTGRTLFNETEVPENYWKVEHFVDQSWHWVINNAILLIWLMWATRGLYRRFMKPADPIETPFVAAAITLFTLGAVRIAACWLLNLYYEGWLIHSAQVLYVTSKKAYHCSYLILIPIMALTAMTYMFEQKDAKTKR